MKFFFLAFFLFFKSSLLLSSSTSYPSSVEEQESRLRQERKNERIIKIYYLIRSDKLEEAKEKLLKGDIPADAFVFYRELLTADLNNPTFLTSHFKKYIGGANFLWSTLALAYLAKKDLKNAWKCLGFIFSDSRLYKIRVTDQLKKVFFEVVEENEESYSLFLKSGELVETT